MADWSTIASVGTAAGTLVLAIATYASVRSAKRSAKASERALLAAIRPVLVSSRLEDPEEKVGFVDQHWVKVGGGRGIRARPDDHDRPPVRRPGRGPTNGQPLHVDADGNRATDRIRVATLVPRPLGPPLGHQHDLAGCVAGQDGVLRFDDFSSVDTQRRPTPTTCPRRQDQRVRDGRRCGCRRQGLRRALRRGA